MEEIMTSKIWLKFIEDMSPLDLHIQNMSDYLFFYRNGKCSNQPVGINTFGKIPSDIAKYLGLTNPHEYSGHTFRR
jgi:DNA-binding MarR family transcriptional regulator